MIRNNQKILLSILVFLSIQMAVAVPHGNSFTYQGELYENGLPANGAYNIDITIHDAQTNGNIMQIDNFTGVIVNNGLFTLKIDVGTGVFLQGLDLWLEVNISPDGQNWTNLPRQLITNSPFALTSKNVAIDGVTTNSILDGDIYSNDLANNSVNTNKIQNSTIIEEDIADNAITSNKIQFETITPDDISQGAIGSRQLLDGGIAEVDFELNSVTSAVIANNTITKDDIDSSSVQERISSSCSTGSSIRVINQDGSVTCETDDSGGSGWGLTGNSGTTAATNYIGTMDNQPVIFKANNITSLQIIPTNENGDTNPNIILGRDTNTINTLVTASIISGGETNSINPNTSTSSVVISGGNNNTVSSSGGNPASNSTISGGSQNTIHSSSDATIGGGVSNTVTNSSATVGGGRGNTANGYSSTIPGGADNIAGGDFSFAAGTLAHVRSSAETGDSNGDEGTFLWSSSLTQYSSTGPNQFLIDATGGVGIGTNAPKSPLHVKGVGTSNGSFDTSNEVVMTIQNQSTINNVALVLDTQDATASSALIYSDSGQIEFDVRKTTSFGTKAVAINHYDADNNDAQTTLMAFAKDSSTKRIDVNASFVPFVNDDVSNGTQFFRWSNVYTTNIDSVNPINVSSDERLKADITNLDYGLAEVLVMRPVSYYWKKGNTQQLHLGLIAQEVETIIPEIVNKTDDQRQMRSMRYGEIVPVLIKATQEQQVIIEQQSKDIKKLKELVEKLLAQTESNK